MEELVIIDGNSLMNRAFYALPLLSNSKGEFSNAVYGFANILIKAILDRKPKYIAVALDYGKKTFRNDMYNGYKDKRKPTPEELKMQFPILKEMLKTMGIFYIEKQGFEADDLIGTLTQKFNNVKNIIVTGDRDSLQLINNNTEVWLTKKGVTEIKEMNLNSLYEELKLQPYQIIELKALMGDSSDNIPGVLGVGEKTALSLLYDFDDIDGVYSNIGKIGGKLQEKLISNKEMAYLSKKLATINTSVEVNVSLEDLEYKFPFSTEAYEFFKTYEFNSLLKREDLFVSSIQDFSNKNKIQANRLEIENIEQLSKQIKHIENAKLFCFELNNNIFSFAYDKNCEFYINIQTDLLSSKVDLGEVLLLLKPVFENENINKYVYNIKQQRRNLKAFNISLSNAGFDCLLAYYLLMCGEREANIANLYSSYNLDEQYLAINLINLQEILTKEMSDANLLNLYNNIEMPLTNVLFNMEENGFKINEVVLEELENRYSQEIDSLSATIIKLAGMEFNINSPKQLAEILFDKLGLSCYNNKKKSTSIEHLEEMFDLHPIVPAIIRYRKIQKIYSTYVEAYKQIVKEKGCIIHTVFNQTLTATGRLSSSEPNLQNIPVRDDEGKILRKMFVSSFNNGVLVSADYSQIELRLLAHMSQDENLINAFNNNIDIHSSTASEVFGVPIQEVSSQMRRMAKAVNFGIIYGISDYGLAQNIGTSRKQAKEFIETYFSKYPKVKEYMDSNVNMAKASGYAYSIFNRRRKINELFAPNYMTRQFGERVAMNMPLQGSASDIIKLAMINVEKAIKENNLKSKLILQVHDELIVDCSEDEIGTITKILKDNMENVVKLSVPLTVDINFGKTWYDC